MSNKPFTGYYGSHNEDNTSKNTHYYGSHPVQPPSSNINENHQSIGYYAPNYSPSVYMPTSTPYTATTTNSSYYNPQATSTPYVGTTTSTPYVGISDTKSTRHYEPKNHLTSHSYILGELKKKKNPSHYSVYRFSIESATIYDAYDSNGLADCYVKVLSVKMIDRRDNDNVKYKPLFKTHVIPKSLSPNFDHQQLVILNNKVRYIDFEVYDKDLIVDDYIGGVRVDIALPENMYGSYCQLYKLTNEKNQVTGTIFCKITHENVERD